METTWVETGLFAVLSRTEPHFLHETTSASQYNVVGADSTCFNISSMILPKHVTNRLSPPACSASASSTRLSGSHNPGSLLFSGGD